MLAYKVDLVMVLFKYYANHFRSNRQLKKQQILEITDPMQATFPTTIKILTATNHGYYGI